MQYILESESVLPLSPQRRPRRGFTLIELLVVISIIGIIVVLGVGSTREQLPRFRSVQVAKDLRQDVMSLRNTAVEQGLETRLLLVEADSASDDPDSANAGSWRLQVGDKAMDSRTWTDLGDAGRGVVDLSQDGRHYSRGVSLDEWEPLSGPWTGNSSAIVFSPRGWVSNPSDDFGSDGYITLTVVNKEAWRSGVDDHIDLKLSRSGNVTMTTSLGSRDAGTVGAAAASEGS
ncbi:MAG: GspH/FimT family pseudopilin [Myxococcota bacterium]|nr:GspH/FimT family pseudopilin [Myxococcota bacterium]